MEKINLNDRISSSKDTIRLSQNQIFNELQSNYNYWGENSIFEMIDFCKRNQLDWIRKPLESLKLIN